MVGTEPVKSITTKRYYIQLTQAKSSGLYYLEYGTRGGKNDTKNITDGISDLNTALYVFEQKRLEYEGN